MSKRLVALVTGTILTALTVAVPAQATTHRWHGQVQAAGSCGHRFSTANSPQHGSSRPDRTAVASAS